MNVSTNNMIPVTERCDLQKFLRGEVPDLKGRMFIEILNFSDEELEIEHDYIQWIFPSDVPSKYNPNAPILTSELIEKLKTDELVKKNITLATFRFTVFLSNFHWLYKHNHNLKRITRVLRCLHVLDMENERELFRHFAKQICIRFPDVIDNVTENFWMNSDNDDLFFPSV